MPSLKAIAALAPVRAQFVQSSATIPATGLFFSDNDADYEIVGVYDALTTVGGAGASVDVRRAPSGTDITLGTTVLAAVIDLTIGADTSRKIALHATNSKLLARGETLGVVFAGTLTGLLGLSVVVVLRPTRLAQER